MYACFVWYVLSAILVCVILCVLLARSASRKASLRRLEFEVLQGEESSTFRELAACCLRGRLRYFAYLALKERLDLIMSDPPTASDWLAAAESDLRCYRKVQIHAIRHDYADGTAEVLCIAVSRSMRAVRRFEREVALEAEDA